MQGILLIYLYHAAADGGLGIAENTATSIVGAVRAAGRGRPEHRALLALAGILLVFTVAELLLSPGRAVTVRRRPGSPGRSAG